MKFVENSVELENVFLSEVTQAQKYKYWILFSFICRSDPL